MSLLTLYNCFMDLRKKNHKTLPIGDEEYDNAIAYFQSQAWFALRMTFMAKSENLRKII